MWRLFIPIILFIVDRIIKYFSPSINFEGGFIEFGFFKNFSGAFSLPIAGIIYNLIGIALVLVFIILFFKTLKSPPPYFLLLTSYLFVILGGISNLFDRLYFGYVIDYVNFLNFSYFNIADGMIVLSISLLILKSFGLGLKVIQEKTF